MTYDSKMISLNFTSLLSYRYFSTFNLWNGVLLFIPIIQFPIGTSFFIYDVGLKEIAKPRSMFYAAVNTLWENGLAMVLTSTAS